MLKIFIAFILSLFKPKQQMAWGLKVTKNFINRVAWIGEDLAIDPDYLMAVMAFESAETFRADIKNAVGSGATGLIQFMPTTAKGLGTSTQALARMTPEDQLNYVYKYFQPYKGRLKTLSDVYMAVLWPKAVGKPEDYVLWTRAESPITYSQNAGLDINKDGSITKAEATKKVYEKLKKGQSKQYLFKGKIEPYV